MKENNLEAKLEAILFLLGEPIKIKKLADISGAKQEEVRYGLDILLKSFDKEERGITLLIHDDRVQLVTKSDFDSLLKDIAKEDLDTELSTASMETLSIIAYLGPCRRSFIDHIRGVNSSYILRSLLVRGLIERTQDKKRTNTFTYQVSFDFLRHMGVDRVEDLPDYEKYREFIGKFIGEENGPAT